MDELDLFVKCYYDLKCCVAGWIWLMWGLNDVKVNC